ncbi:MAG: phytanoyl-CoA dioxygenase family protein [Alphaproteobacteria bacterium]|nr:phytanoyl-CoA dioxygenase family protein [Alphaproteobacteria bacterium]
MPPTKHRLSDAEVAQYHEDGYVVPDFRLPDGTLDAIRADHDRLIIQHPEYVDYCPALLAYDLSFLNYARTPVILDMVEQLIGPDIALWNSSFFAKPANKGRATPWHQDGEYWPIRPLATCTAWIAVDDSTPENGCLRVIKGSHKTKRLRPHDTNTDPNLTLNQELPLTTDDENSIANIVLKAGQISLHDVFLAHGSAANTSGKPRRGMTLRFMPTSSIFDRALATEQHEKIGIVDHSARTLFLMRGGDVSGQNDFQVRR